MYLPKNRYKIIQSEPNQLVDENGTDYNGFYIETYKGQKFKGDSLQNIGEELFLKESQPFTDIDFPYNDYIGPSTEDYNKGSYTRYFIQDNRNKIIKEVGPTNFIRFRDLEYVSPFKMKWDLKTPGQDITVNGLVYKGSINRNKESIESLSKKYPKIVDLLNPSQYIR